MFFIPIAIGSQMQFPIEHFSGYQFNCYGSFHTIGPCSSLLNPIFPIGHGSCVPNDPYIGMPNHQNEHLSRSYSKMGVGVIKPVIHHQHDPIRLFATG